MIRVLGALFVALAVVSLATPAFAQIPRVEHPKETIIIFSEVGLDGQIHKPDSDWVRGRKPAEFDSLIQLRQHFLEELADSVDDI